MNDVRIHHVLKDGTQVDSVEGHLIMAADHPVLYETINRISQKEGIQSQDGQTHNNRHHQSNG